MGGEAPIYQRGPQSELVDWRSLVSLASFLVCWKWASWDQGLPKYVSD